MPETVQVADRYILILRVDDLTAGEQTWAEAQRRIARKECDMDAMADLIEKLTFDIDADQAKLLSVADATEIVETAFGIEEADLPTFDRDL